MLRRGSVLSAGVFVLLMAAGVSAQTNATIAGTIKDATGAVMPGVTVEASSPALIEKTRSAVTDGTGQYRIVELAPGAYSVTFTLPGFTTVQRDGIQLTTGFTAVVNAEMRIGEVAETITVSGQSPIVDVQNVVQQRVMTREIIDALPTAKAFGNLGMLIPGVGAGSGTQDVGGLAGSQNYTLQIHGGRSYDMANMIDGFSVGGLAANGSTTAWNFPDQNVEEVSLGLGAHSAEVETGGIRVNIFPKSGSNFYRATVVAATSSGGLQFNNLDSNLRSRGLLAANANLLKYLWDVTPAFGGPLRKNRLWFFLGFEKMHTVRNSDVLFNKTPNAFVFTPDTNRESVPLDQTMWSVVSRFTLQATTKDKFNVNLAHLKRCDCTYTMGGTTTYEAAVAYVGPTTLSQATWTNTLTNHVLLEGGVSRMYIMSDFPPEPGAMAPAAVEQATGFRFRSSPGTPGSYVDGYPTKPGWNYGVRGSVSYVTGTNSLKAGFMYNPGRSEVSLKLLGDYSVVLLNGVPTQAVWNSYPGVATTEFRKLALFTQDQWKKNRMTVNAGVRFDIFRGSYPTETQPGNNLIPSFTYPGADVLHWNDVNPRLGFAYDLFGNGRTALKFNIGRYQAGEMIDTTQAVQPAYTAGGRLTRTWTDTNGNFVPDGDPLNPVANGELGPSNNLNFGKPVVTLRYDPTWTDGWGKRGYNWETSGGIQHELLPSVSVNGTYFRRSYGNLTLIDNLAVSPTDYDSFCITAPSDSRLPGGGGQQICGLADLKPAKLGQLNRLQTLASNYGNMTETWQGLDFGVSARLPKGLLLQGGTSSGKSVTDACDNWSKYPELKPSPTTPLAYCHAEQPILTQVKFVGSYILPGQVQLAATLQSIPGISGGASSAPFGLTANYVATNAQVAPSLGRNLSAGANGTVTVNIIPPGSMMNDRTNQLDVRLGRTFVVGRLRVRGMFDVYNITNANPVLGQNGTYGTNGAAWLVPQTILPGRLLKFATQLDF